MNHFVFSALTTCISATMVAVYFISKDKPLDRFFGIYWGVIAFWSSTVAFQSKLLKVIPESVWGWLLHLGCVFIPAIFLHLAVLLFERGKRGRLVVNMSYFVSFGYIVLNTVSPYFTHGTSYRDNYAYPTPSNIYPFYFVTFILMIIYGSLLFFIMILRATTSTRRNWLILFLIVHSIAYIGAMDNFFIMADIRIFPWYPYGLYPVALYAIVGGYAFNRIQSNQTTSV